MPHDSLHTVFLAAELLGVHCNGCSHRAILRAAELPNTKNNMTLFRSLKLLQELWAERNWQEAIFAQHPSR